VFLQDDHKKSERFSFPIWENQKRTSLFIYGNMEIDPPLVDAFENALNLPTLVWVKEKKSRQVSPGRSPRRKNGFGGLQFDSTAPLQENHEG